MTSSSALLCFVSLLFLSPCFIAIPHRGCPLAYKNNMICITAELFLHLCVIYLNAHMHTHIILSIYAKCIYSFSTVNFGQYFGSLFSQQWMSYKIQGFWKTGHISCSCSNLLKCLSWKSLCIFFFLFVSLLKNRLPDIYFWYDFKVISCFETF